MDQDMKKNLRISFSSRGDASESYRLSQQIVGKLLEKFPGAIVIDRDFGTGNIAHVDRDYAISQGGPVDVAEDGSLARSDALIAELESADVLVISTPMHNLTMPSALKAWIDHIVRVRKTFNITPSGKVGTLGDRPVFIAIASGGRFSGERQNQPDFLTPYLRVILTMIGLEDITFFSVQGTGAPRDVLVDARAETDRQVRTYFSDFEVEAGLARQTYP
jgi:FMN-dependent NADH-azoreductase